MAFGINNGFKLIFLKILHSSIKLSKMISIYIISLFIKREDNYIAFGSWLGEHYLDNSKYLVEHFIDEHKNLQLFWIGNKHLEPFLREKNHLIFLEKNTYKSILALLKCRYMFCTQMHNADLCDFNVFIGAKVCYLHHGVPLKRWGDDVLTKENESSIIRKYYNALMLSFYGVSRKYEYFISSSPLNDIANYSALKFKGCNETNNLKTGYPRNDFLLNSNIQQVHKKKKEYSKKFNFDISCKVIMYLPTYRRTKTNIITFTDMVASDKEILEEILLNSNSILLEKNHFATVNTRNTFQPTTKNVIKIGNDVDIQEMLLFTDILITDYSGAFLDYILLDKPVIHFAYDLAYYQNIDSGLYYQIEEFSAGRITYTFGETFKELNNLLENKDNYRSKRNEVRKKFMAYETGSACEKIYHAIINKT